MSFRYPQAEFTPIPKGEGFVIVIGFKPHANGYRLEGFGSQVGVTEHDFG